MTRNQSTKRQHPPRERAAGAGAAAAGGVPSRLRVTAGAGFAAIGVFASLLLVLEHLGGMSLPGCGAGSACAEAANSAWGRIRLGTFEWPVSYLGLAYFLAALATWLAARGVVPQAFRYFVRLGALVSLAYCALIVAKWMVCPYCLAAHVGNFAFWITVETSARRPTRAHRAMVAAGGVFAAATLVLGLCDARSRAAAQAQAETDRAAAAEQIIARSNADPAAPPGAEAPMFTGRYRIGPAEAPIRIVMFTDYQCQDCAKLEEQLAELQQTRTDLSISIKHFPFNSECNPAVPKTLHANACWAARAAEAAGQLWGPEGFWKVHMWLFDRRGVFENTAAVEAGIREMGYDPAGFVSAMTSAPTLQAVRADAEEAVRLGLYFTPMIFINGVELKGWAAPGALRRTIDQVAATNPPPRSAAFDRPPSAFEKYLADWRDQPQLTLPPDPQVWALGPDQASVKIVLWGDYQEAGTTEADAVIRAFVADRTDVQYTYRHYPFNSACNPNVRDQRHPYACRAARAAEAAGRLAGNAGYWKLHAWLMENRPRFSDESLRAAAPALGFDAAALLTAMDDPELEAAIQDDIRAGKQLPQLRHGAPAGVFSIPTIFVNGRYVPRWKLEQRPVLKDILHQAAGP